MWKTKVSWLLSLVLVLTLALSFSFPSLAAGPAVYVGSGPYKQTLTGPVVDVSVPRSTSTSTNVAFYEPFEISQIVSVRNWNGGNAVQLGGVYDGFHLYTRLDFSSTYVRVSDSSYVAVTNCQVYVSGVTVSQDGLSYDLPVTSSSGSSYVFINHDFYTDISSGKVSQIFDESMLITFRGYVSGYALNSHPINPGVSQTFISATARITPQINIAYSFDSNRTAFVYGIDTPFVSSSDINNQTDSINNAINNQTNSINNNITNNITNQTNSINNNINQATQNQTNTLTGGYDNSGMENTNKQLADSLASYDQTESQVTDQSVAYIDAVTFFDPTTHLQLMTSITYVSTFLQNLFVSLGDWSVLVMISLSLAFALMLIGWFKYRK